MLTVWAILDSYFLTLEFYLKNYALHRRLFNTLRSYITSLHLPTKNLPKHNNNASKTPPTTPPTPPKQIKHIDAYVFVQRSLGLSSDWTKQIRLHPSIETLCSRNLGFFYGLVCQGPDVKDSFKDSIVQEPYIKTRLRNINALLVLWFRWQSVKNNRLLHFGQTFQTYWYGFLLYVRSNALNKHWRCRMFAQTCWTSIGCTVLSLTLIEHPCLLLSLCCRSHML